MESTAVIAQTTAVWRPASLTQFPSTGPYALKKSRKHKNFTARVKTKNTCSCSYCSAAGKQEPCESSPSRCSPIWEGFHFIGSSFFQECRRQLTLQALASQLPVVLATSLSEALLMPRHRHGTPSSHAVVYADHLHGWFPPLIVLSLSAAEDSPFHMKADPEDDLLC